MALLSITTNKSIHKQEPDNKKHAPLRIWYTVFSIFYQKVETILIADQELRHLIHHEMFKGEWGDELVYAMLQSEWRQ